MTTDNLFQGLALTDVHQDIYRNIVSLRNSENLFDDLSDNSEDWQAAIDFEIASKPTPFISEAPIIHRPFEESAWNEAIGFPFREWSKSRYSDGTFGVWYGAATLETSVFETVYHWRNKLLADAGFLHPGISIDRRVHLVRCDAALVDLRSTIERFPLLIASNDYTLTQQIGSRLHREGHPGLVSISARCDGDVFAVLNPDMLSDPRQCCYLTYTTTTDGVDVRHSSGEVWFSI
jgi:hypothetical protein